MGLRVQKERMKSGVSVDRLHRALPDQRERRSRGPSPARCYLHPGPINEGVEVTREVCLGPRSLVLEQARNGVPIRMAVLSLVRPRARGQAEERDAEPCPSVLR